MKIDSVMQELEDLFQTTRREEPNNHSKIHWILDKMDERIDIVAAQNVDNYDRYY